MDKNIQTLSGRLRSLLLLCLIAVGLFAGTAQAVTETISTKRTPQAEAVTLKKALFNLQVGLTTEAADLNSEYFPLANYGPQITLAALSNNPRKFAFYRGLIWVSTLETAYSNTLQAIEVNDYENAKLFSRHREYSTSTRFLRPNNEGDNSLAAWVQGEISSKQAYQDYEIDLLSTFEAKMRSSLKSADADAKLELGESAAYKLGLAKGYYAVLKPKFALQKSEQVAKELEAVFAGLEVAAGNADFNSVTKNLAKAEELLTGFVAVPLSTEKAKKRAGVLMKFLELVPIEYGRGVKRGQVVLDLEIQEALTFLEGASVAVKDLETHLSELDPQVVPAINAKLEQVHKLLTDAQRRTKIVDLDVVEAEIGFIQDQLRANLPESWLKDRNADFAILKPLLQQMQILAEAADYENLEKLRLEAYGIFDLGPELRLMAFDRNLVAQIDGLFWQGIAGKEGLADQIKAQKSAQELKQTLGEIKVALALAERKLGGNVTPLVAIINSAIVVFREGIEAILIIFALLGSLALSESTKVYRRPLVIGVAIGVFVSILTWFLAQTILLSFLSLGEKLEAIVSLIAIAVLLLITNWFFHNTYWNRWNANLHQHKQNLLSQTENQTEATANKSIWQKYSVALGFCLLGLSSVYREGFETVLFLQVWVLDSGLATVAKGVLYGSVALTLVAILTFYLQKRLPYMKMLVLTGFMIVAILITMVGQTVHTLQAVGWMSITPIGELTLPYWVGLWFGLFATVETIVAQILALVVVGGSYFGAEYLRQRKSGRPGRSLWHRLTS